MAVVTQRVAEAPAFLDDVGHLVFNDVANGSFYGTSFGPGPGPVPSLANRFDPSFSLRKIGYYRSQHAQ